MDFSYAMEEAMSSLGISLIANMGSSIMSIVIYVFTSLSFYTIAKRRGIRNPWMAWVPVANCWIVGSISDQYRYVAKGETKNKRKVLLILNIASCVLAIAFLVLSCVTIFGLAQEAMTGFVDEEALIVSMLSSLGGVLVLALPMAAVAIAYYIIYHMALYDVFGSCEPNNKVIYLVVSIFIGIAGAIFLFICRGKDDGMPPRKVLSGTQSGGQNPYSGQNQQYQAPQYQAPQYQAPQYQAPQYQAPQYQAPQYQAPQYQAPQYQAPQYQAPQYQAPQPIHNTQELHKQEEVPSPYSQWPDPYAPQHPEQTEEAPEQL